MVLIQSFGSLVETLKERLRNDQDQGMVEYQEGVERRLQRPVDAGDQQPSHIGAG